MCDLVALEALVLFVNLVVKMLDEVLGFSEKLFLRDKHAVVAAHVVEIERKVGRAVVAEQAVLEGIRLDFGAGCDGGPILVLGTLAGRCRGRRMLGFLGSSRRVGACRAAGTGLGSVEVCVFETVHDVGKVPLGVGVGGRGHGLAEAESRAQDGARDGGGVVEAGLCEVGPVLLAVQVVVVGILAVVRLLAGGAGLFERGPGGGGGGRGLVGEDLFGEDLGGEGRQRGDAALEVVAAGGRGQ
jgi:hypothetical protein